MLANTSKDRQSKPVSRHGALANGAPSVHAPQLHLKAWRLILGYTLEEAAARIGVHFTTIDKWERGINQVGMKALTLLGQAYDMPPLTLALDPGDAERATRLITASIIIHESDPVACDKWLQKGRALKRLGAPKKRKPPVKAPPASMSHRKKIARSAK